MSKFDDTYINDVKDILKKKIKLSYAGPFDSKALSAVGKNIEDRISYDVKLGKKIFKIFIELAQNIALYSNERNTEANQTVGEGIFIVEEHEDCYIFSSGNIATSDSAQKVIEKCDKIVNLDREGLRMYKRKQRSLPKSKFGGANIGIIQVALLADNPVYAKAIEIDEETSFLSISGLINKNTAK